MNRKNRLVTLPAIVLSMLVVTAGAQEHSITPPPAEWTDAKKTAVDWVDAQRSRLNEMSLSLWEYAEPGMLEYRSAELLADALEDEGFSVERGVAGMPTACTARYGSGRPVVGFLAEYDALGGLSQDVDSKPSPRIKDGAGHGCGHNLFGTASVAAAMAAAQAIKEGKSPGTVVLFGTPNEEGLVGKAFMARDGVFDGLDACLHWHPDDVNEVYTGESDNDLTSFMVAFYGQTAHSAGSPWKGRSALDAVELMGVMANYYREHLHPSARIHYVIMEGGKAPNVVPDFAKAWFYLRGGTREMVDEMFERIEKMAQAAALATDTRQELRLYTSVNHTRNNTEGAKVMHANLQLIGAPEFTEEEQAFAKAIQKRIGIEEKGLALFIEDLAASTTRDLDRYIGSGSTDVAEVSLIAPTMGVSLAASPIAAPSHHWSTVACSGHSIGEKAMLVAAKVMAATALDIIDQPSTLVAMQAEFEEMMQGEKYRSSIPDDVPPPTLPNPYENPDWEPGDLDYPSWSSFKRSETKP